MVGLFISLSLKTNGQHILRGYSLFPSKQPITGAIVEIYKVNSQLDTNTLLYSISDGSGFFSIDLNEILPIDSSIRLKVATIGYKLDESLYKFFPLSSGKPIHLILNIHETILPTVVVKAEIPISQRGDTTIYNVNSFVNENDRTIGDVIAKLPGVSVDASGNITFNGKNINTYYIQGLNLFEDRYSVPNNNIRPEMVEAVEMISDHQPIRMLDSISGNSPALNLRLKKNALNKVLGNFKVTGGIEKRKSNDFFNSNNAIVGMRFAENMQTLAAYKYSSNGESLFSDIGERSYNIRKGGLDFDDIDASNKKKFGLLGVSAPPISEKLYNLNNSNLFLVSALLPLKRDFTAKINTYYITDRVYSLGEQISNFILTGDSIATISEVIKNNTKSNSLYSSVVFERNNRKNYFRNAFQYESRFASGYGQINNRQGLIHDNYKLVENSLTNDFKTLLKRNKTIYHISSKLFYSNSSNPLSYITSLFNTNFSFLPFFDILTQNYDSKNFLANTGIGFTKNLKHFRWTFGLSDIFFYRHNHSNLTPSLLPDGNLLNVRYFDSIGNNSGSISQNSIIADAQGVRRISDHVTVDISIPVSFSFIRRSNSYFSHYSNNVFYSAYSPSVGINYNTRKFMSFGVSALYSNNINVDDNISSLVMNSYRSYRFLQPNILRTNRAGINFFISRNNSLKALFMTAAAFYGYTKNNFLDNASYVDFYSTTSPIDNEKWGRTSKISLEVSKYFNNENINLKFKTILGYNSTPIAIDSMIFTNLGNNLTTSLDIGHDGKVLQFRNNLTFTKHSNKRADNNSLVSNNLRNFARLSLVSKKVSVVTDFDYYLNSGTGREGNRDYNFLNSYLRFKQKSLIIETGTNNILNEQQWSLFLNSPYYSQFTSYNLRGRTYFLRLFFKL